tara:strand:- start:3973 stop:4176 length:204 start_codon:yes stop_codon:yes gene_type:complete
MYVVLNIIYIYFMAVKKQGLDFLIKLSKQKKILQKDISKVLLKDKQKISLVKYIQPEKQIVIYKPNT